MVATGPVEEFLTEDADPERFRVTKLPSAGIVIGEQDQKTLFDM